MKKHIQSVLDLSKYNVGDVAYWIILEPQDDLELDIEDEWVGNTLHPYALYARGPARKYWPYYSKLPKLPATDFFEIIGLLRSDFVVEEFEIHDVARSRITGDFMYYNCDGKEWMPEDCLLDTKIAARKEINRIKKMIKKWLS